MFATRAANARFAIGVVNLPLVVPFVAAFRDYHLDHHRHLGVRGVDGDVLTRWEQRVLSRARARAAWLSLQIVAYALRPVLVAPRPPTRAHALNVAWQAAFDVACVAVLGWPALRYLLVCVVLAGGAHPCAGHFLSEHRSPHAHAPLPSFSYYGPLNVTLYHVEHHDFPRVPWTKLPHVRRLAPEAYAGLPTCASWCAALRQFVRHGGLPACDASL